MNPEEINPELTKDFVSSIEEKSETGVYRVEVGVGDRKIPIDVFPTVFPPKSDYSASSKSVFETFGNLDGLEVADIGSGSGIESIVAILAGAKHVDASDINEQAVLCTRHNVVLNKLQPKIDAFMSDLFENFPNKKYDLIIANLPIVNYSTEDSPINKALYDSDFEIHKRLFLKAKDFLSDIGLLTFTHANLQSAKTSDPNYDFGVIEDLIGGFGYEIKEKVEKDDLGYRWINYKIKPKK